MRLNPPRSPYLRRTLALALPVALQMLLQSMLGMADVAMVSGLGENAVAAVGLAAKIHFLLMVLMLGIAGAASTLIAQYHGANNVRGMRRTLAVTLVVGLVIGLPLMLALLAAPFWTALVNPDPAVVAYTGGFLVITAPVLVFIQITVIYEGALRATGNMVVPLMIGAATVLLNILFNWVFIQGHLGVAAMGVKGAALGTLLARALQTAAMIVWVYRNRHPFALNRQHFRDSLTKQSVRHFSLFSAPLVANYGVWGLGNTVYHILIGFSGTSALAVMGVMAPLEAAFFASFLGLSSACAIMIGQALGADQMEEAKRLQRFFTYLIAVLTIISAGCLWGFKALLVPLFGQLNAQALDLLLQTISIFCVVVIVKCMNMLMVIGVLRAGGDNHFCLKVDFIAMWMVGLPIFGLAVAFDVPFVLLYLLLVLEDLVKIGPFILRIRTGAWLKNLVARGDF